MFNPRLLSLGLILLLGLVIFFSCAKAPEKEMQEARDAVASAVGAEADAYSSELFTAAQDALNQAEQFVSEKKYGEAKNLAKTAKTLADSAAFMVPVNKEEIKTLAEEAIAVADKELSSLKKARIPSKLKSKINQEVKSCGNSLQEAETAFDEGNYKAALDKADDIINRVKTAKEEIIKTRGVVGS